jgi:hypothetical protein
MYSISRRFFVSCFAALIVAQIAFSKPDGAPIESCEDMTPQHFVMPQSSVCPFTSKLAKVNILFNQVRQFPHIHVIM